MSDITLDDIILAAYSLQRGNNGGGTPPKELCSSGQHEMAEFGRQIWKTLDDGRRVKNGRYCLKCKSERQLRDWHAKRKFDPTQKGVSARKENA